MSTQRRHSRRLHSHTLLIATAAMAAPAVADDIYFADIFNPTLADGSIRRVATDGSGLVTLVTTGGGLRGVDVDRVAQKIYWCDVDNFAIRRANLDGSGQEDVITAGLIFPVAVRIDPAQGRLYWGDPGDENIYFADLASPIPAVLTSTVFHRGLALDTANNLVYWSRTTGPLQGTIARCDFSGSNPSIVVPVIGTVFKPGSIAVAGDKVYWTDPIANYVRRANLDGTNMENLFSSGPERSPNGIAVDLAGGKVYWGQSTDENNTTGALMRMNLDGTGAEVIIIELGRIFDMAFVATGGPAPCYPNCDGSTVPPILNVSDFICFQTEFASGSTYANCDGSTVQPVLNVSDFICFQSQYAAGCS